MDKRLYWGIQIVAIIILIISTSRFNSEEIRIFDGSLIIPAGEDIEKLCNADLSNISNVRILGTFTVLNGTPRDIEMYVFDDYELINWENGYNYTEIFSTGRVAAYRFDLQISRKDMYHVVLNNQYSSSQKEVDLGIRIIYTPVFLGLPISVWILSGGILIIAFFTYYQYASERKKENKVETNLMAVSLILIAMIGVSFFISSWVSNMIGTLLTAMNVILVIWNVRLTQKNMKLQLLHVDRKRSIEKLWTILEKSKDYSDLIKKMKTFMKTLDFDLLSDSIQREIRGQISTLIARESEAPWNPPPEHLDAMIQHHEESQEEYYASLSAEERADLDLNNLSNAVKNSIKKVIRNYFEEPSEE